MDVTVESTGSQDLAFARNRFCSRADDYVHTRLGVGVTGFANLYNAPVLQANIGFVDAGDVNNQCVGDDRIYRSASAINL